MTLESAFILIGQAFEKLEGKGCAVVVFTYDQREGYIIQDIRRFDDFSECEDNIYRSTDLASYVAISYNGNDIYRIKLVN